MRELVVVAGLVAVCLARVTTEQKLRRQGYDSENVAVTIPDGYKLTMHHLIRRHQTKCDSVKKMPVVFLQHGLFSNSETWVSNNAGLALAHVLADRCMDVWMGNTRGTFYSQDHEDPSKKNYWQFTWEDMTKYDLPAMIEKVKKTTGQEKVYYIGHSQGTLIMFAKLASDPAFAKNIIKFFALAPISTLKNILSPVQKGLAGMNRICNDKKLRNWNSVFPPVATSDVDASWTFTSNECQIDKPTCKSFLDSVAQAFSRLAESPKRFLVSIPHLGGTSFKNLCHFAQMSVDGDDVVRGFNYSEDAINQEKYGKNEPPIYDYSKITVDTYLYWSPADFLASKDVEKYILVKYDNKRLHNEKRDKIGHTDFTSGGQKLVDSVYLPIANVVAEDLKKEGIILPPLPQYPPNQKPYDDTDLSDTHKEVPVHPRRKSR